MNIVKKGFEYKFIEKLDKKIISDRGEYKDRMITPEDLVSTFNELGKEGWEFMYKESALIDAFKTDDTDLNGQYIYYQHRVWRFFFKRSITIT